MTTTIAFTPQQKLALIKHLAGGKDADMVATIMHTTREAVVEVARGHGYPDTAKLSWAADVLAKNIEQGEVLPERPLATGGIVERPRPTVPGPQPISAPTVNGDDTMALLNEAKAHASKRIQSAADKALDAIGRVRDLIAEDEERHSAKRKADAAKAAARAEVERLEKQLAEAKAKLRGGKAPKPATAAKATRNTAPKGDYPCRLDGCDKHYDTPQGRSLHERLRCELREQAAS